MKGSGQTQNQGRSGVFWVTVTIGTTYFAFGNRPFKESLSEERPVSFVRDAVKEVTADI